MFLRTMLKSKTHLNHIRELIENAEEFLEQFKKFLNTSCGVLFFDVVNGEIRPKTKLEITPGSYCGLQETLEFFREINF